MGLSQINLTPLIDTSTGIFCHLLEIGKSRIIIDCGIGPEFDYSIYDTIKETVESADGILITSFDVHHMGAVGLFKDVPVYCSIPTAVLGQIILQGYSKMLGEKVLSVFDPKQIKFSQPFKINETEVVCYNTGFTLGNSSYKIKDSRQTLGIGYNINHRRENFLNGFNQDHFEKVDILITNSSYSNFENTTLKSRDEFINNIIESNVSKIVITVSYTRLLELLTIISNDVLIISSTAQLFIQRTKSMIEWAGTKAEKYHSFSNCHFGNVSNINEHRIIVVVEEIHNQGYLGTVLETLGNTQGVLLTLDREESDIDLSNLCVYQFSYSKTEIKAKVAEVVGEESCSVSEESDHDHWSLKYNTKFVEPECTDIPLFPSIKRRRQHNPYGEPVIFQFENKIVETESIEIQPQKFEIIESKKLLKVGTSTMLKYISYSIPGISDARSFKTIIDAICPSKLIFVNDFKDSADYLCFTFNLEGKVPGSICENKSCLKTFQTTTKAVISDEMLDLQFRKIQKYNVSSFIALKKDSVISKGGDNECLTVGYLDTLKIKKELVKAGYNVEDIEGCMLVNNSLKIKIEKAVVEVESNNSELLVGVRNILYEFIAIV